MVTQPSSAPESSNRNATNNKEATVSITTKEDRPRKPRFKLKGIWRETQLAQPKMPQDKFVPPYDGPLRLIQKSLVIDPEILLRCNQLAFAHLRVICDNKKSFKDILEVKKIKNLAKQEEKTINSIYFFYRKHQMMKEQKAQKMAQRKALLAKSSRKKIVKETDEQRAARIQNLATPKKLFVEPPPTRGKWKPLEKMNRYMDLAESVKRDIIPPRTTNEVSKAAKSYTATDIILKLFQQPRRFEDLEPPLPACRSVPKSALTYKITPAIEKLYVVKIRKDPAAAPEEEFWKISAGALKYKATPRILQLAKPIERK